jgi:hypothetical protein
MVLIRPVMAIQRPVSARRPGSAGPDVQCADLACEIIEIDVIPNDDVPIGMTDLEVVAQQFPLSDAACLDYSHVGAALGQQLVDVPTQREATATFGRNFRHE